MDIIISIRPQYAEMIFSWEKKYELRRVFTKREVEKMIIYETNPVKQIIWEVEVEKVLYDMPYNFWKNIIREACVDIDFFDKYFEWKQYGYAIKLKNPKRYISSKRLEDFWIQRAPQSFCFLKIPKIK